MEFLDLIGSLDQMIALLTNSVEREGLHKRAKTYSFLLCIREKQYLGSFQFEKHFKILKYLVVNVIVSKPIRKSFPQ